MTAGRNESGKLEEDRTLLSALESQKPSEDDSAFRFFASHRNLRIDEVNGTSVMYTVDDTLEYYDEEELERLLENSDGWAAICYDESFLQSVRALLLEKRGILRVCASFRLSDMSLVSPLKGEWRVPESVPNPHIYSFACSGANAQYYARYAKSGDWDLAVEQSISAAKNWNVGDSTVGRNLFSWLESNDLIPCIYVGDGSRLDGYTEGLRLVSFDEFKKLVSEAKARESEGTNG